MKLLLCNLFVSYTLESIRDCLKDMGHSCFERTYYTPEDLYEDKKIDSMLAKDIKLIKPDAVISINFWPPIARACKKANVKYLSYGYDSPQNIEKTDDMEYETNYIFLFDRLETEEYRRLGIDRVFHAPLATSVKAFDMIKPEKKDRYSQSFIGSIYESTFPAILSAMDEYHQGFYKGLIKAQQNIYGYYLVDDVLTKEILESTNKSLIGNNKNNYISKRQLSYSLGSYITYLDRMSILSLLSNIADVHLFTGEMSNENKGILKNVKIYGKVSYDKEMPRIFKESKININPIFRAIKSGVSQRALDVMASNAFLLSSYQQELAEYFIPNEEVVMFDSYEDAMEKAAFYLKHDDLRTQIAANAYEKIKRFFTYEIRLKEMFEVMGLT